MVTSQLRTVPAPGPPGASQRARRRRRAALPCGLRWESLSSANDRAEKVAEADLLELEVGRVEQPLGWRGAGCVRRLARLGHGQLRLDLGFELVQELALVGWHDRRSVSRFGHRVCAGLAMPVGVSRLAQDRLAE